MRHSARSPQSADLPESADDVASPSRRSFLGNLAALTLAVGFGGEIAVAASVNPATARVPFEVNAFIRIGADGIVSVVSEYLEMGQGTFTGVATLAAEELDIGLDKVRVVPAPADVKRYANPMFAKMGWKIQATPTQENVMTRIAKILTAAAVACAVLAPTLAEAHSHRVCHFDHHHHRVCRWVH